ncbi:MAG: glycoside hydrolase family 99-like domain-containing protein [Pseudobacteriovorax sp.]|nr:glycoside hydrolase family 99-like domain-containing protein [Pseudobacteriovorax sp.]
MPKGLSQWNPAGLNQNWIYEGTAFFANPNSSNAIAVIELSKGNKSLLTTSESEALSAVEFGFSRKGVAFYAPTKGRPVHRFRISDGSYFYSLNRSEGDAAGYIYEGIAFFSAEGGGQDVWRYRHRQKTQYKFLKKTEASYQVGAYYFEMWSPKADWMIEGTKRVHGRDNDWWGSIKDFYGKEPGISKDTRSWGGDYPHLKPSLGYYNSQDLNIMEQHIEQAADAGLSFFNFYWYWDNRKGDTLFGDGIKNLSVAKNRSRMDFAISLYAHPWSDFMHISKSEAPRVVDRIVSLFARPEYLTVNNRPYFVLGDSRNIGQGKTEDVANFLGLLKAVSKQKLGVEPYILVSVGAEDDRIAFDGKTCLVTRVPNEGSRSYDWKVDKLDKFHSKLAKHENYSPCLVQNFDERPRQDVQIGDRNAIRFLTGKTPELFRASVIKAKKASDQQEGPLSKIINVYAWNEWHEGGVLEPNVFDGATDLNILTDVFHLSRKPSKCLDSNQCIGR